METLRFDYEKSEKVFEQPTFKKIWREPFDKQHLSTQLLFVTKNKDQKLCCVDLNSFTYHKIVQGLQGFGKPFLSNHLDFSTSTEEEEHNMFFVQFNDKIGARFDENIMKKFFGKTRSEDKIVNETCKTRLFENSKLELFIVVQQLENKIHCFVFGRNGSDKNSPLTKKQIHHFLLCLYAFTEIK
jgi:hypothetical protein